MLAALLAASLTVHSFQATAYCKGQETATGTRVGKQTVGLAAADPEIIPLGSIILVDGLPEKYNGIYVVLDTGPAIQGRILDIYMWSCYEALDFGRQRNVQVQILRKGWTPSAETISDRGSADSDQRRSSSCIR